MQMQGDAEGKPIFSFRNPHLGFAQLSRAHQAHNAQQLHLRATPQVWAVGLIHSFKRCITNIRMAKDAADIIY